MRIAFLLFDLDRLAGASRSVVNQANALADQHDVRIVSVVRSSPEPHFAVDPRVTVDHLVHAVPGERPAALLGDVADEATAAALAERSSVLVPSRWDGQYTALTDAAMESYLPGLRADVLLTLSPVLLAAAVQLAPKDVALVHLERGSRSDQSADLECLLAFAPRADAVVVETPTMADWLRERLGPVTPPLEVLPVPLPTGFLPRSRLDYPLIVAGGRLRNDKQFVQLVSAFGEIADRIPEWRLRILGTGPVRQPLFRQARKLGLWDRVELPGSTTDMRSEWARASIAATTTRSVGCPLAIQEAMAAGVPVAGFDASTGAREVIEHEVNGLLVPFGSASGLASALLRLATDDELRLRLGAGAYRTSRRFAPEVVAARWAEVYAAATERRRARAGGRQVQPGAEPSQKPGTAQPQAAAGTTPAMARAEALQQAVHAADRASSTWFVMPPDEAAAPLVVLPMADRDRFLEEIGKADLPAYLSMLDPGGQGWPERRGTPAELATYLRRGRTSRIVLEPWPMLGDRPSLLSEGCGVEVEFWEVAPGGDLVAPSPNRYTNRIPPHVETVDLTVEGVAVRSLPLMTVPTVSDCRFPVDVVYTWVDGGDPIWNTAREERLVGLEGTARRREISGRARFDSRDELRYSMRSIHLFAPWVRRIHLVTAGQVPDWLDTGHPSVRVVDHAEILPRNALPTFNSRAIETALHHVPDLTEHWVYLNDDVFLARPVHPETFFTPSGLSSVFLSQHSLGLTDLPDSPPYLQAAWNNRRLLRETFGVVTTHTLAHTPHPHRRSVLSEIEQRFPDAVERTARTPFRSETDVSMLSSLAQHYGLMTGTAVARTDHRSAFVNLGVADLKGRLRGLLDRDQDFICIGDNPDLALRADALHELLAEFLDAYFPVAAPWESS